MARNTAAASPQVRPKRLKESAANRVCRSSCKSQAIRTINAGQPQSSVKRVALKLSTQVRAASQNAGLPVNGRAFKPAS